MGPDGKNGADANATCKQCHNDNSPITVKQFQFANSMHAAATTLIEANNKSCAPCHSGNGFKEVVDNNIPSTFTIGADTTKPTMYALNYFTSSTVTNDPAPISCETCHKIHTAYDTTDFNFRFSDKVPMLMYGGTKVMDAQNSSNLCMKCHQPRPLTSSATGNDTVPNLNNLSGPFPISKYGNHHGTVAAIYSGMGGMEIPGTQVYTTKPTHSTTACATCHMAPAVSDELGGHTFSVAGLVDGTYTQNVNGCNQCHDGTTMAKITAFYPNAKSTEIQGMLNTLGDKLNALSLVTTTTDPTNKYYNLTNNHYDGGAKPKTGSTNLMAAAVINFQLVLQDRSLGIHNFDYTKALLSNTIDALTNAGM
jgi:nitrate/TMAO reductase-like tetraheme cytochrome c subunit